MSKNILVTEGRRGRRFGNVKRLKTELQGGGSCLWVPEDEVQLETLYASENGTFRPERYGFDEASVHVIDGSMTDLSAFDNLAYLPTADGFGKVEVNVPNNKHGNYSDILQIKTAQPDPNYEYHFSISGFGDDYYEWERDGSWWDDTYTKYQLMIDSHLPFYIKRFDIPAYYTDRNKVRHDVTIVCYTVRPYVYRSGGLAVGTKNYRLRLSMDGRYRCNYPDSVYGNRDVSMTFDGEIICPASSSNHSKWSNNDGSSLTFHAWDQEDEELHFSDDESYVYLAWRDGTVLQQYLDASPYEIKNKLTYVYYPIEIIIGEIVYGEAPRVSGTFGTIKYYYNTPLYDSSAGINFGNNPLFTGTYNEYRTYIEQNFR